MDRVEQKSNRDWNIPTTGNHRTEGKMPNGRPVRREETKGNSVPHPDPRTAALAPNTLPNRVAAGKQGKRRY